MKNLNLFIPLTKVDVEKRLVYGIATAEQVDKSGEIMDYESTVPYYKAWSAEIHKASDGKSLGNVREMHTNIAAGKLTQIEFDDVAKTIGVCAKVVDESSWSKVLEGVLTGFSQGGKYIKTWKDSEDKSVTRYTADPSEISLVDNPCLASATFEVIKADGTVELRKFKETTMTTTVIDGKPVKPKYVPLQKWEASDGKIFAKKEEWRIYELELEAKTVMDPALAALAELNKAVTLKEGKEPAAAPTEDEVKKAARKEKKDELFAKLKKSWEEAYDAKAAIEALITLESLLSGEAWEAMMEGEDESAQMEDLAEAIKHLKAFIASEILEVEEGEDAIILELAAKFEKKGAKYSASTKAQIAKASGHLDSAEDNLGDAKKAHGHMGKTHDALRNVHKDMEMCMKAFSETDLEKLEKAKSGMSSHLDAMDAHLDKAEKHLGKMSKAHDATETDHKELGKALGAMKPGEEGEAEKVASAELQKVLDKQTALEEKNAALETEKTEMKKTIDKFVSDVPALVERIRKLEAQPAAPRGSVFTVEKGHEANDPANKPVESVVSSYGESPEEQRQRLFGR